VTKVKTMPTPSSPAADTLLMAQRYQGYAEKYEARAHLTVDPEVRAIYDVIAGDWRRLANEATLIERLVRRLL
jgi:hypothetical protein